MNMIGVCVVAGNVRRCLPEGTNIHTKNGLVPIEHIKIGDEVLTSTGHSKVSQVFNQGKQKTIRIITQDGEFECTPNHRMAVLYDNISYLWKPASSLKTGEKLVTNIDALDEQTFTGSMVVRIEKGRTIQTYDIEVENVHEFFANGYLTHNSAEISVGNWDDTAYTTMKDYVRHADELKSHRWASNNSVFAEEGVTDYAKFAPSIAMNGEPGIVWLENMRAFSRMDGQPDYKDKHAAIVNPCGEQTLFSSETCCLIETFPSNHDSYEEYRETLKSAYLYGKTVTLIPTHWPETNAVILKNRRLGLSQSGIIDAFVKHGRHTMIMEWCRNGYTYIQELDKIYSDWLCIPRSIKTTTVKPSGTVSLLAGVNPGIHYPHAEYYIRRVRVATNSPLVACMREAGYDIEYEVSGDDEERKKTSVVSFPMHDRYFIKRKADASIWEQTKNAVDYQRYWSDNNVSITVTFNKQEEKDIVPVLQAFEHDLKAISFFPLSENGFTLAPYEEITKAQYEAMVQKISPIDFSLFIDDPDGSKFCDGESCQIP
jgi:ribonucleoside-triphosphate reductase (thioredoxin)